MLPPSVLVDAARCWRHARGQDRPTQPSLASCLDTLDCVVLAPVIDSFCLLFEGALGRPFRVGRSHSLSSDERLMVALLEGPATRAAALPCEEPRGRLLDLAIRSTRIMVALTLKQTRRARALTESPS
ncbi:hypothetical protein [Novosphingobium sp.]|jgi:hypothetical protein|uniref:hypothetical protein n=1 Tax=Novosphingobium sp. TaxID=1874826 RepID=UPI003D6D2FA6